MHRTRRPVVEGHTPDNDSCDNDLDHPGIGAAALEAMGEERLREIGAHATGTLQSKEETEMLLEIVSPLAKLIGDLVDPLEADNQCGFAEVSLLDRLTEHLFDV